jgi:hypothetical protein
MKGNDFVSDKIVARGDVLGNLSGRNATFEQIILYPFMTVAFPAHLVDLEPLSVGLVEFFTSNGTTRS